MPAGRSSRRTARRGSSSPRSAATRSCARSTPTSTRLLGPVALLEGRPRERHARVPGRPSPLPGRGISVKLDDRCARGFCLPKDAKASATKVAHMAWNSTGTKVAVLVGDDVHVFDAASKAHESIVLDPRRQGRDQRPDRGPLGRRHALRRGRGPGAVLGGVGVQARWHAAVGPIEAIGGKDEQADVDPRRLVLAARQEPRRGRRAGHSRR